MCLFSNQICCTFCDLQNDWIDHVCVFQLLSVSAIVLANLCVSYIMTSQNEEVSSDMLSIVFCLSLEQKEHKCEGEKSLVHVL